ncbi:hypothetical protein CR513_33695, partial [Mucuna pruriens]
MTQDKRKTHVSKNLQPFEGGIIAFGGNQHGKVYGIGKMGKSPLPIVEDVLYLKEINYHLLNISQFCGSIFMCSKKSDQATFSFAKRHKNLYKILIKELNNQNVTYLIFKEYEKWIYQISLSMLI